MLIVNEWVGVEGVDSAEWKSELSRKRRSVKANSRGRVSKFRSAVSRTSSGGLERKEYGGIKNVKGQGQGANCEITKRDRAGANAADVKPREFIADCCETSFLINTVTPSVDQLRQLCIERYLTSLYL
jgi:hypothetical protein